MIRHFLTLNDFQPVEILSLIDRAIELKRMWRENRECPQIMRNRSIALVFEKSSTRTRVSFEVAANQLGGSAIFFAPGDSHVKRGESVSDTARILSGMADLIVIRTGAHSIAETYAEYSTVPVINGLSDSYHPCQLLADVMTYQESRGPIYGATVAWVGDGNNMCVSWAVAASQLEFTLRISTPSDYGPDAKLLENLNSDCLQFISDPYEAATDADIVVTDTWMSMGQEDEKHARMNAFEAYRVTESMMSQASADAIFMHCLPAYRGLEVDAEVLDGPKSVVWQEAENRLHAQKALIELLLH